MTRARLEAKIGFDKVREIISNKCQTEYAADRVAREDFSIDESTIRERLALTDEMRLIVMFEDGFPTTGYIDAIPFLKPLEKSGSSIDVISLGKLSTLLEISRKVSTFFSSIKDSVYPLLKKKSEAMISYPEVRRRIEGILDKYGEIKDSASPELLHIRTELRNKEEAVSKKARAILKKAQDDGISDPDSNINIRDGKILVPVITSSKRKLAGYVYDCSASGKTTFIEPAEIVELENEVIELHFKEAEEIARILFSFTEFLRPYIPELLNNATTLGEMDFLLAKAQTALDFAAGMPIISQDGSLSLRKARHPILEKNLKKEHKEISPLTITLTSDKRILLISGPNAGGKSVCMKTVGLLQYMFQWGMLIPTSESSELPIFNRIEVCIGDDQSLENDLSTYSSFLLDMKQMLSSSDEHSLILIDEFGSGTEPTAGGAIAEAILSEFDRRGCYGVLTTHYTNLKLYASKADTHVINGAMLYDTSKIAPLFKLEIGLPGNSFAFELARKMGLPENIVKDAESRAGEDFVDMEKTLRRIVKGRRVLDEKIKKVKKAEGTLEGLTEQYQQELESIKQQKQQIIDNAKKEAESIVKGANKQVEKTIRDIKESSADKVKTKEARNELQGFIQALETNKINKQKVHDEYINRKLEQLKKRKKSAKTEEKTREEEFRNAPLKLGEKVKVKSNGMVGEIVNVSSKEIKVVIGNIISKMTPDKVERISSNEFKQATKNTNTPVYEKVDPSIRERKLNFSPEIDLRGERLSSAMERVTRFIDDAIMTGVSQVRIIHGKGSGVLHEELQKYLRTMPGVSTVNDEDIRQGGSGVTIVTLE